MHCYLANEEKVASDLSIDLIILPKGTHLLLSRLCLVTTYKILKVNIE